MKALPQIFLEELEDHLENRHRFLLAGVRGERKREQRQRQKSRNLETRIEQWDVGIDAA